VKCEPGDGIDQRCACEVKLALGLGGGGAVQTGEGGRGEKTRMRCCARSEVH
jgi:hypothetical protein